MLARYLRTPIVVLIVAPLVLLTNTLMAKDKDPSPPPAASPAPMSLILSFDLDPTNGELIKIPIIPPQEGKMFYGHMLGSLSFPEGNLVNFSCISVPGRAFGLTDDFLSSPVKGSNSHFTCSELYVAVFDIADDVEAGQGHISVSITYFENADAMVVTAP
jgi:hypothetical protein